MALLDKRIAFMPFEYPEIEQFAKALESTYWVHDEIVFDADKHHYYTELTDTERYIVGTILKTFAQTEVFVADEFWAKISQYIPKPEVNMVAAKNTENEWRHASAYARLNTELGLNDFDAFLSDEIAKERFENLASIGNEHGGKPSVEQLARTLALFGCFTENVNLFSQFAILRSFSANGRNLLPNIADIIDWSQLDEQIHAQCAMYLFNILKKEYPYIWKKELKADIYKAAEYTYEIECHLIDQIFSKGELPNLSKDELLNFMRDRINRSLKGIGLKAIMDVDKDLLKKMKWFYDEIDATHQKDFFARRVTEYTKNQVTFNAENVRVTREDIKALLNNEQF